VTCDEQFSFWKRKDSPILCFHLVSYEQIFGVKENEDITQYRTDNEEVESPERPGPGRIERD
jgi:hypothetical protein